MGDLARRKIASRCFGWRGMVAVAMLGMATLATSAHATWSIIIVNMETKEVAVGSATCLTFYDLKQLLPVVIVGKGAAAAQSRIDSGARNRSIIWSNMQFEVPPEEILAILEEFDSAHQSRQYGIVDTFGRPVTFTGSQASDWAGGLVGQDGPLVYAIQGNILTGESVVLDAEAALLSTPGDIPEKLMAAMEAARAQGGDGRCASAGKSAHIGFMIVARPGDIDGICTGERGCANGDYFMTFNIANANSGDPDPVFQMQDMFDIWRDELLGRPDAGLSMVDADRESLVPDGSDSATLTVYLHDWQGFPVEVPIESFTVEHHEDSDMVTEIGEIIDLGGGQYSVEILGTWREGTDQYIITANDGIRPVQLMPMPAMTVALPTGSFHLENPDPGIAGQENTVCITNGTPDATAYFLYSFRLGATNTPCGEIGLQSPVIGADVLVGEDGTACFTTPVPRAARGRTVNLQAVQVPGCDLSNVVSWTFE